MLRLAVTGWLIALSGLAAAARAETFQADPVHSMVIFRIQHLGVSFVYGRFNDPAGTFILDADPAKMSFDVSVEAAKVDTNNKQRDDDLRSQRFFDVARYPTIHFKSTSVKAAAGEQSQYEVAGDMTLHGVTRPITVKMHFVGKAKDPQGKTRAGFETTFAVKRSDYGMTTMLGGVGDEVTLMVNLEGIAAAAE